MIIFSQHSENLCWTFLAAKGILNNTIVHLTVTVEYVPMPRTFEGKKSKSPHPSKEEEDVNKAKILAIKASKLFAGAIILNEINSYKYRFKCLYLGSHHFLLNNSKIQWSNCLFSQWFIIPETALFSMQFSCEKTKPDFWNLQILTRL